MTLERSQFIFGILLVAFFSFSLIQTCSYFLPSKDAEKAERLRKLQQQRRESLVRATDSLLAAVDTSAIDVYIERERAFSRAVRSYLSTPDTSMKNMIVVKGVSHNVIIPVHVSPGDATMQSLRPVRKPLHIWRHRSGMIKNGILDVGRINSAADTPYDSYAVLYRDRVDLVRISQDSVWTVYSRQIPPSEYAAVSSQHPIGFIQHSPASLPDSAVVDVFHSEIPHSVRFLLHLESVSGVSGKFESTERELQPVPGQSIFTHSEYSLPWLRSYKYLPGTIYGVGLALDGKLYLVDRNTGRIYWGSDKPWGTHLAVLDEVHVAVYDRSHQYFYLFKRSQRSFEFVGKSPTVRGAISGITSSPKDNPIAITVFYAPLSEDGIRVVSLPWQSIPWEKNRGEYTIPAFPDFNAKVTLIHSEGNPGMFPPILQHTFFETLYKPAQSGGPVTPNLVSSGYADDSNTVWTFRLRPDATFSDGDQVLANDIKRSWEHMIRYYNESNTGFRYRWLWEDIMGVDTYLQHQAEAIAGIVAVDQRVVRVEFSSPKPEFRQMLSHPVFSTQKFTGEGVQPKTTSAFQLFDNAHNRHFIRLLSPVVTKGASPNPEFSFARNPFYYGGYPFSSEIQFHRTSTDIPDTIARSPNLIVLTPRTGVIEYLQQLAEFNARVIPDYRYYALMINPSIGPLRNPELRRRIAHSLDKEVTAKLISGMNVSVAQTLFSSGSFAPAQVESTSPITLKQPLRIVYQRNDVVAKQIAERLAAKLNENNIPHQFPEPFSEEMYRTTLRLGKYDIIVTSFQPEFSSALLNLMLFLEEGYVVESDLLLQLDQALAGQNTVTLASIERSLIERAIMVPVFKSTLLLLFTPSVQGVPPHVNSAIPLEKLWIIR